LRSRAAPRRGAWASRAAAPAPDPPPKPTVILQRLVTPALPPNPATPGGGINPNQPYNPYVTVDYVETAPPNEGRVYDTADVRAHAPPATATRAPFRRSH